MKDREVDVSKNEGAREGGRLTLHEFMQEVSPQVRAKIDTAKDALEGAALIRSLRRMAGISQGELAQRLGVSPARISQLEKGAGTQGPTYTLLKRIARVCGTDFDLRRATVPLKAEPRSPAEIDVMVLGPSEGDEPAFREHRLDLVPLAEPVTVIVSDQAVIPDEDFDLTSALESRISAFERRMKKIAMNKHPATGGWKELKGRIKQQWGSLTDEDLTVLEETAFELHRGQFTGWLRADDGLGFIAPEDSSSEVLCRIEIGDDVAPLREGQTVIWATSITKSRPSGR